jgi:hypothetical protein
MLNETEENSDFAIFPMQKPKFEVLFKKIHPSCGVARQTEFVFRTFHVFEVS